MGNSLLRDVEAYPDFFDLRMPISPREIDVIETAIRVRLPPSYREVLEVVGQGSLFDGETLLGGHEVDDGVGTLEDVNRELREKQGLDPSLIVFHIGHGGLHAFDAAGPGPEMEVVELDGDTLERGDTFATFEDWYLLGLRSEYAGVLGLE